MEKAISFMLRFLGLLVLSTVMLPSLVYAGTVENGYYYIISANAWSYNDQTNAVYASDDYCRWGKLDENGTAFVWQFTALTNGNYRVRNLLTSTYINNIAESEKCMLGTTAEVTLTELAGGQFNITVVSGGDGSHKMHCKDHNNGSGRGGDIVGWDSGANGPSAWRLEAVEEGLLEALKDKAAKERALIQQKNKLISRITEVGNATKWAFTYKLPDDAVEVTPASADDFNSNAAMLDGAPAGERHGVSWGNDGKGYGALIDGRLDTYFHTTWKGVQPEWTDYNEDKTPADGARRTSLHNLSMKLRQPVSTVAFLMAARKDNNNYNNPTKIDVEVSNDGTTWQTAFYGYDFFTPNIHAENSYLVGPIDLGGEYQYVRIANYANDRSHDGSRFFCLSELKVYGCPSATLPFGASDDDRQALDDFLAAYSEANRYIDTVTEDDVDAVKSAITSLNTAYNMFKSKVKPAYTTFTNPVLNEDGPDPSVIRGNDGYYYMFTTAEHVYRSKDMVNWTYVRQAFGDNPRPTFVDGVSVYWAPCVTEQDGRYVLYFALSKWGGGATASIGVATSDTPDGPYRLVGDGKLFTSAEVGVENSIDPFFVEDNGKKYIIWGSWNGIWAIELTEDGLAVKNISRKKKLADTRFEASYIYKRGNYYYLFCSIGACCEGINSTYQTVVGRSTSLLGTYKTRDGESMLNNAYRLFLNSNGTAVAPGHNSRIIEDEAGQTWMYYHAYRRDDPNRGRLVWLDRVLWDEEGWPYIAGGSPSGFTQMAPITVPFGLTPSEFHREWAVSNATLTPVDVQDNARLGLFVTGVREEVSAEPYSALLQSDGAGQWQGQEQEIRPGRDVSVVPCDINADGKMDLVVFGREAAAQSRGIFLGNGDGTFRQQTFTVDGGDATLINQAAVADVNNDGWADLIVVGNRQNAVLLQRADFTFQAVPFNDDATFLAVRTADFNKDGFTDIFAYGPAAAELYLNDGTGMAFASTGWAQTLPVPTDGSVAIADFSYNSYLDLFIAGDNNRLLFNDGENFAPAAESRFAPVALTNHNWSSAPAVAYDWDGDNYFDLLYQGNDDFLGTQSGSIWIRKSGVFSRDYRYLAGSNGATAIIDWNGDGKHDIVSTGLTDDRHLLPDSQESGITFAVTYGSKSHVSAPNPPSDLKTVVEGQRVTFSWRPLTKKNTTYELYIRDAQGHLLGNCRSYVGGSNDGLRKCMDIGQLANIATIGYTLPAGHYTWGIQSIDAGLTGSAFAVGEFDINEGDAIDAPSSFNPQPSSLNPHLYNTLGQRITPRHKGLRIVRYSDGTARKQIQR